LIASGGQDGLAKVFNTQSGKSIVSLKCCRRGETESSDDNPEETNTSGIESVLFSSPEINQLLTGTLDGTLTVWDLSTQVYE
jgi:WD40 repeat protein